MGKHALNDRAKILLYSHDTFGAGAPAALHGDRPQPGGALQEALRLGAHGLADHRRLRFRTRVDFVRIPGVIKLRRGNYTPLSLHMNIDATIDLRRAIIEQTAEVFDPDIFIADKEPLGLRGEVEPALQRLKAKGTHLVLGLRDVLDSPDVLRREWRRKGSMQAVERYYDELWVYGLEQLYQPLQGLRLSQQVRDKMVYTGYLGRSLPASPPGQNWPAMVDEDFLLVMTGGGGDGDDLIDWILSTYEQRSDLPLPALLVLGPFMPAERREAFLRRADALPRVEAMIFDSHVEHLIQRARAVVSMGGYNTFCEILSYDKPALIVPRTVPRKEQFLRASRAQELGLVRMLAPGGEGTQSSVSAGRHGRGAGRPDGAAGAVAGRDPRAAARPGPRLHAGGALAHGTARDAGERTGAAGRRR